MFCEIQRIAQEYDKVHPTRGMEKTKFIQIWEETEKIGIRCNPGEPYHHKCQEYNDIYYGKLGGLASDKILIRHVGF